MTGFMGITMTGFTTITDDEDVFDGKENCA